MGLFYAITYPCDKVRDFMYDHLEGNLPALVNARFLMHLSGCPQCREYLDLYQRAARLGSIRKEIEPPPELLDKTLEFLKAQGIALPDEEDPQPPKAQ